jgi:hypothetical protein
MSTKADVHVPHGSTDGEVLAKTLTAAAYQVPVLFLIPVTSQTAGTFTITVPYKVRVTDIWAVHTGGAGEASDTLTVGNAANAISNALDWSGADKAIVRAAEIDDAYQDVAKGGTIRVTTVDNDVGNDVGLGIVYVLAMKAK